MHLLTYLLKAYLLLMQILTDFHNFSTDSVVNCASQNVPVKEF